MADYLPALVNGARAFVMIGAAELFWVATAWPSGTFSIVIIAVALLLLSPRGDLAYRGAIAFAMVGVGTVLFVAVIKFAVLPRPSRRSRAFALLSVYSSCRSAL